MRKRPALAILLLLTAVNCSRSSSPPEGSLKDGGTGSPPSGESGQRDGGRMRGLARPKLEFLPFDGRLLELIGDKDLDNRYANTVMIDVYEPPIEFTCSGILVHPLLVLTAGHCVCQWRKSSTPEGAQQTVIDGTVCARHAKVTAIVHESKENADNPSLEFWERTGTVRPHPEFESKLEAGETVLASRADLAVILLEQPIDLDFPIIPLANSETAVGETLAISGYGSDPGLERLFGNRYFRNGKVKRTKPLEGRALYEPAGAYFNTSYRGGPCLREHDKNRWITGIVGLGTDQEMSFTSVYFYRAWLHAELKHATAKSSPSQQP